MIATIIAFLITSFVLLHPASSLSTSLTDLHHRKIPFRPLFSTVNEVSSVTSVAKKTKPTLTDEDRARILLETQAGAILALETNSMVSNDNVDDTVEEKIVKKKTGRKISQSKKIPMLSPREASGLNFTGIDKETGDMFEYDVPFLDVPKWYRILVRKNSERKICESFLAVTERETSRWWNVIVDAYFPKLYLVRYKNSGVKRSKEKGFVDAKELVQTSAPMVPGVLFIKCKMNPEIAEDLEAIQGVRYLAKNEDSLVLPLSDDEEAQLEILKDEPAPELSPNVKLLRTGEYVSVVSGRHAGKYGIIQGSSGGKITVLLRTEYKDYQDNIELENLKHLSNPPEKNYKTMTAKEAVEALMIKEPNGEMLRFLRKEGLLNEILYPDGRPDKMRAKAPLSGREGGASQRSIAKESYPPSPLAGKKSKSDEPDLSDFFSSLESQDDFFPEDKSETNFAEKEALIDSQDKREAETVSKSSTTNFNKVDSNIKTPIRSWSPKNTSPNAYPPKSTNRYDNNKPFGRNKDNNRDSRSDGFDSYDFKSSNGLGYDYSSSRGSANLGNESPSSMKKKSDDFDSFIEQMLKEVDGGRDSAQTDSPKQKYTSVPVVNDDFDMDWLDSLQPSQSAPPSNDRSRPRSPDLNSNKLDSESVLDDLIKELKLGDSSGKTNFAGGGGWESRNNKKVWDSPTKKVKQSGGQTSPAPKEDQFDSFEAYLDALVNFERKVAPDKKWGKPDKDSIYSSARLDFEADNSLDFIFAEESDSSSQSSDDSSSKSPAVVENKEVPSVVDQQTISIARDSAAIGNDDNGSGDLNSLPVKELKERLKGKGMKVSGTKAELIDRLLQ